MKLLTTISLAAAITLSGSAAFAQMKVGKQDISKDDMAKVTEYCATLKDGSQAGDGTGVTKGTDANGSTDTTTGAMDLKMITAADCKAAGLKTMM